MRHDIDTRPPGEPADVLLVTAPDCHFCADGKATLARLSCEFPVAVREVAWSSAAGQDLVARHGIVFPPGLLLDGVFVGFGRVSERKLRRLLERRARRPVVPTAVGG